MTYIDDAYPEELDDAYKQPQHFPMTLNKSQFEQFVENYALHIIEGMDSETMEQMVFDLLTREYETYTEEQIVNEITEIYGEEFATELLESVDEVPVA
jgi:hypothetical protein